MSRAIWTALSDDVLLAQCEVDTYRASGPGGQKRNKTSSAVRIRHLPSGLLVIAEESRSQHENKAKALLRLKRAFWLELREIISEEARLPESLAGSPVVAGIFSKDKRLHIGVKNERFWPLAGLVLDLLDSTQARVSEVAAALSISTGNLIDFLRTDEKVWQVANQLRVKHGQHRLKDEG